MRPEIAILTPTWGRPERLRAALASALETAANPGSLEFLTRVSPNDPELKRYRVLQGSIDGGLLYTAECDPYPAGIEWLQRQASSPILFCGGDDVLFRTPNWDERVREAFAACEDGLLVAYANNGLDREKCEHFFTTRRWIDAVGYLMWTEFRHFCCDQWVEEIAQKNDRLTFLRDVVVEHMHKKYRKAPDDDTYRMVRGTTRTSEKDNELFAARGAERADAMEKVRAAIAASQ